MKQTEPQSCFSNVSILLEHYFQFGPFFNFIMRGRPTRVRHRSKEKFLVSCLYIGNAMHKTCYST